MIGYHFAISSIIRRGYPTLVNPVDFFPKKAGVQDYRDLIVIRIVFVDKSEPFHKFITYFHHFVISRSGDRKPPVAYY